MSSPVKAPKRKKPLIDQGMPDKKNKKIRKDPDDQNKREKDEREDQKDERGDQGGFENEPLKEEDIDSLFMM
jgi:hypothetical protein